MIAQLILSLSSFLLIKRFTAPFLILTYLLFTGLFFFLYSIYILPIAFFYMIIIYFFIKKIPLNYSKRIISISYFLNKIKNKFKKGKLLGSILPYTDWQMKYNNKDIYLSEIASAGGTLITGSVGSGKTFLLQSLIEQDMINKKNIIFFDFKGEKGIINHLKSIAKKNNINIFEMSSYDINFNFEPLSKLSNSGKIEALLNTRRWSSDGGSEFYRIEALAFIQKIINEFKYEDSYLPELYEFLLSYKYDKNESNGYHTLLKTLNILLNSSIGPAWKNELEKKFEFVQKEQYIVIFSFMSSSKELANTVSSFVFKNLLDIGTETSYDALSLYIDEFGSLENSMIIKDILEKGRSCGICTFLALQDINQIILNNGEAYLNSILGTINTFILFSGATKNSAEKLSGLQIGDIEKVIQSLKKPRNGPPTAMFISRYADITETSFDVFKFIPRKVSSVSTPSPIPSTSSTVPLIRKSKLIDYQSISENIE